jgi:hypothetical protein
VNGPSVPLSACGTATTSKSLDNVFDTVFWLTDPIAMLQLCFYFVREISILGTGGSLAIHPHSVNATEKEHRDAALLFL